MDCLLKKGVLKVLDILCLPTKKPKKDLKESMVEQEGKLCYI